MSKYDSIKTKVKSELKTAREQNQYHKELANKEQAQTILELKAKLYDLTAGA